MNKTMKRKTFNNKGGFKPILKSLPVVFTGKDVKGYDYNVDEAKKFIMDLEECGCFKKLSVTISLDKSLIGVDGKGRLSFARVQAYDPSENDMSFFVFTKNKDYADKIDNYVIVPKIRTGRDGVINTVLNFEIIDKSEIVYKNSTDGVTA